MITANDQRSWFQQLLAQAGPDLPGSDLAWLAQARDTARQAVSELAIPHRKQEAWRYTSIDGLLKNRFEPAADASAAVPPLTVADCVLPALDSYRLVLVNGRCVAHLSSVEALPAGVTLGSLRTALTSDPGLLATWFGQTANHTEHVFTALNTALVNDGVFIHVANGVALDRPLEVVYLSVTDTDAIMIQPRNLVVLEAGASATLVERCIGSGQSPYFHNNLTEIAVGEGAALHHYRLQDESRSAYHLSSLYLSQAGHSHYHGTALAFGGAWARTDYNVRFRHAGAECTLNGLYTAGDKQLTDLHLNVQHSVPGCASRERFKGILYGRGRAVFDGRILVEKQAQRSDAFLSNDNLMLTRDAEVDTKPQLEIYADDVKCSHGTTVGQLDPQQVFYLRSRGIDEAAARRMLCLGFAGEILDSIGVQPLREHVADKLAQTLNDVVVSKE